MARQPKVAERVQGPVFSEAPTAAELGFDEEDDAPMSMLPVDDEVGVIPPFTTTISDPHVVIGSPMSSMAAALPEGWNPIATAPCNRSLYLTADPASDAAGALCYWRTTRFRDPETRRWQPRSYWARLLNRQRIDFEPVAWKEANGIPIFQ